MTEYDLRKLPSHRFMEAQEKARILLYQRAYNRGKKITPELVEEVKKLVEDVAWKFWEKKDNIYWLDFGEEFLKEVFNE